MLSHTPIVLHTMAFLSNPVVLKLGIAVPLGSAKQFQRGRKEVADFRIDLTCTSLDFAGKIGHVQMYHELFFAPHLILRGK